MIKFNDGDIVKIVAVPKIVESYSSSLIGTYGRIKRYLGVKEDTMEDYYLLENHDFAFSESDLEIANDIKEEDLK